MSRWDLPPELGLDQLVSLWLNDLVGSADPKTIELYRLHWATHLIPHFRAPHAITAAGVSDYSRRRLRVVKRTTLRKERSTLRGFLDWAAEQGYLLQAFDLPPLPKRATGTAYEQRRRGVATPLSPEECRKLLALLPEWSCSKKHPAFPVRSRFVLMYETALRPATLDQLSAPEHYTKGASTLRIEDEIDKARFGRELPLTDLARAALDSVTRTGVIFGGHDYRHHLKQAAKRALSAAKARTFCAYDLRHARLTELAETGNLPGVAYLAGHKRVTTTSIYVRPGLKAAERVLDSFEPDTQVKVLMGMKKESYIRELCEEGDSNPHTLSGASTSS